MCIGIHITLNFHKEPEYHVCTEQSTELSSLDLLHSYGTWIKNEICIISGLFG